jgi:hypothetical protein
LFGRSEEQFLHPSPSGKTFFPGEEVIPMKIKSNVKAGGIMLSD